VTAPAVVDQSAWGWCRNCYCDLPDGGDLCDGCPRKCSSCFERIDAGDMCAGCSANARHAEGDQLAHRLTVTELVATYMQAERDIRDGFALVSKAMKSLDGTFTLDGSRGVGLTDRYERVHFEEPERNLVHVRRSIWKTLVERMELRRMMSVSAWKALEKQIEDENPPEITAESVHAMAKQFSNSLPEMLEQAVNEVFDFLRPPHSEYKRNSEFEVPRRVALRGIIDQWYTRTFPAKFLRPRHEVEPQLTALENVFSSLDGKGSTTKSHYSQLSEAIKRTARGEMGQTEYFAFRGYNNGALHLEFKRLDLLKRFNQIAGGARLRAKAAE